eukprot:SAG31_NODE_51174_length_102_cov_149.333333_1_plen_28_part_10
MNGRRCPDRVSYGCVVIGIGEYRHFTPF